MPTIQLEADKLRLFILVILSVLVLNGCGTAMPAETSKPAPLEKEAASLQQTNKEKSTADQAPNRSMGTAPALVEEEGGEVVPAKKLEPCPSFADSDAGWEERIGFTAYTDSFIVNFMRDFNRLWDNYWGTIQPKDGNLNSEDLQKVEVLKNEYEELRKTLQFSIYENSTESAGFLNKFKFLGDLAIRHRIHAVQHVLLAIRSDDDTITSPDMDKTIGQISQAIVWSNEEVEKMNTIYADYIETWGNTQSEKD